MILPSNTCKFEIRKHDIEEAHADIEATNLYNWTMKHRFSSLDTQNWVANFQFWNSATHVWHLEHSFLIFNNTCLKVERTIWKSNTRFWNANTRCLKSDSPNLIYIEQNHGFDVWWTWDNTTQHEMFKGEWERLAWHCELYFYLQTGHAVARFSELAGGARLFLQNTIKNIAQRLSGAHMAQ